MCCVGAQLDELITCSKDQICLVFSTPLLSARQDFQDLKINIFGLPLYAWGPLKPRRFGTRVA